MVTSGLPIEDFSDHILMKSNIMTRVYDKSVIWTERIDTLINGVTRRDLIRHYFQFKSNSWTPFA